MLAARSISTTSAMPSSSKSSAWPLALRLRPPRFRKVSISSRRNGLVTGAMSATSSAASAPDCRETRAESSP